MRLGIVKRALPFRYEPVNEQPQEDILLSVRFLWIEKKKQNPTCRVFIQVRCFLLFRRLNSGLTEKPVANLNAFNLFAIDQRKKSFWHKSILSPLSVLERAAETSRARHCHFAG